MSGRALVVGLSLSPTWLRGGAWRREDSRVEEVLSGQAFVELGELAERACLDFVFKPDALTLHPEVLEQWPGFTGLDPIVIMTAVAQATQRIGVVPTYSSHFFPPYLAAREVQSLNRLSRGRAGWNVVTSLGGAENFATGSPDAPVPTGEELYEQAADYVATVRDLWASYPAAALHIDRRAGRFADVSLVRPIPARGGRAVSGPLTVPSYDDGRVPTLHAGGSLASRRFAARHADAVFGMTGTVDDGVRLRRELRELAVAAGRRADDIRVLAGVGVTLADSRSEAESLREQANRSPSPPHVSHWQITGTPADAEREILLRFEAGALDGVIALPGGSWRSIELFLGEVVPALAAAGVFRSEYSTTSLSGHLGITREDAR